MDSTKSARAMLRAIANAANERWGQQWQSRLVAEYAALERSETGNAKATPANRRNQVLRLFEDTSSGPTLETFVRLTKVVGIEVELQVKKPVDLEC